MIITPTQEPDNHVKPCNDTDDTSIVENGMGGNSKFNPLKNMTVLRSLMLVCLFAGSAIGGAAVGWWVRDGQAEAPAPLNVEAIIDRPVSVVGPSGTALGRMPAVLGLSLDQARRVLFDAGVPADSISVAQRPSALEQGLVLLQEPPASAAIAGSALLVVSVEAAVPNLVGLSAEDAQTLLEEFGTKPTIQLRFDASAVPGTVLGSNPPAGKLLERSIVLEVSSR